LSAVLSFAFANNGITTSEIAVIAIPTVLGSGSRPKPDKRRIESKRR
jgi:hypothetical protein